MMPKYIQVKQVWTLVISLIVLALMPISNLGQSMNFALISFFAVFCGITFIPIIKKELGYSDKAQAIIYYIPMFIWIFVCVSNSGRNRISKASYLIYIAGIVGSIILILFRYRDLKQIILDPQSRLPITKSFFLEQLIQITVALVSEEIYFSWFLIGMLREYGLVTAVIISTSFFLLAHVLNRWAAQMFIIKDYIFIVLLGIIKAVAFYYTDAFWLVVVMHLIYNFTDYFVLIRRFIKSGSQKETTFFNDYLV